MPSKLDFSTALETSLSEIQITKQTFGPVSREEKRRQNPEYLMMHVENVERGLKERAKKRIAARKKRSQLSAVLNGTDPSQALNLTPREIMQAKSDDIVSRPLFAAPNAGELPDESQVVDQTSDDSLDKDIWECLTTCGKIRKSFGNFFGEKDNLQANA